MQIEGSLDHILASLIPHEVNHLVLAEAICRPLPRWADEGAAVLAEDQRSQERQEQLSREILSQGRAIPLKELLTMREYPRDVMALYAQGYSLVRLLVQEGGHRTFLDFLKDAEELGWDKALETHYRFGSVSGLQTAWIQTLNESATEKHLDTSPSLPPASTPFGVSSPTPALAVLTADGSILVSFSQSRTRYRAVTTYQRDPKGGQGVATTSYEPEVDRIVVRQTYEVDKLKITTVEATGRSTKHWREALRRERPVMVFFGEGSIDPMHAKLYRKGTLVLTLPGQVDVGNAMSPRPPEVSPQCIPGELDTRQKQEPFGLVDAKNTDSP